MKLLFYIPGLVDGGAERVMASLASAFARQGHTVMLAVDFKAHDNSPPLDPAVKVFKLPEGHKASILKLARLLVMTRPDIAISAIASCNFKLIAASLAPRLPGLSKKGLEIPPFNLVLTYHGFEEYKTGWMSWLGYVTLPVISRIAKKVVAVSSALQSNLARRWGASRKKLVRIYNPVDLPDTPEGIAPPADASDLKARENIILGVGRLVADKRFDLVIKAFAKLRDKSARLILLGEGPERENLVKLIEELGLSSRVELPGFQANTGSFYSTAKCFVLASKKESFGLVLVEALAFGLPVVATDCGGPREVLDSGRYGVLLEQNPTSDELAKALEETLASPGDPKPRMERAKNFDMKTGQQQYQQLFTQILRENADERNNLKSTTPPRQ